MVVGSTGNDVSTRGGKYMSRDGIWEVIDTLQTPRRFETALRKSGQSGYG